jgi:hypothetical protein
MIVSIIQSNYLPWKGYFDILAKSDIFVFHDDLQYTKNDWRNRNQILTINGPEWLTIPCGTNEKRLISDVSLSDHSWQLKHWNRIESTYKKSPFFYLFKEYFESFYLDNKWINLSELNKKLIIDISKNFLGLKTEFKDSSDFNLELSKGDRVLELLKKVGAKEYISGPAAMNYLDPQKFEQENIGLTWMDFSNYPSYPQFNQATPTTIHKISVIDLLFNTGKEASQFMLFKNSQYL